MKRDGFTIIELAVAGIIIAVLVAAYCTFASIEEDRKRCGSVNLLLLRRAMDVYANGHDHHFPSPDKWCDLLLEYTDVDEKQFRCPAQKRGRCHYAMNPNAEPNSPGDVVLLFETKGGWNQSGGPEILSTKNHWLSGCNVRFVDGHGEWVKAEDIGRLNWGTAGKEQSAK
ncbi:MAG TPA: prepilin-type N-terminal cleavage/methylation domain-containing protein [Sedimentisphaerales bacterium]|nr:prepilin-type N-terminal cleavage/methylation domain-containing protein [Sedimentisphaerales bacterium]